MDTDIAPVLEGLEEHYERSRRFMEALQQSLSSSSRTAVLAGGDASRREKAGDEDMRHADSSADTLAKFKKNNKSESAERWMKSSTAPSPERLSRLQRHRRNSITELPEPSRKSLDVKPGVLCFDDFAAPNPAAVCWSGSATAPSLPSCSAASPRGSTHRLLHPATTSHRSISSPIDTTRTTVRPSDSRVSHRVSFCTTDAHGRPLVSPTAPMPTNLASSHTTNSSGTEDASLCPGAASSSGPATDTTTGAWTASAPQASSGAAVASERGLLPSRQSSQQRLISQLKQLRSSGSGEVTGLPSRSAGLLSTTARRASLSSFSPPGLYRPQQQQQQQQQQQAQDAGAEEDQPAFNILPWRGSSVTSGSNSVRASLEAPEAVHRCLHRQGTTQAAVREPTRCPSISASQAHIQFPPDPHHDSTDAAPTPSWRACARDPAAWYAAVGLAPAAGGAAAAATRPSATSSLVFTRLRSARTFRSVGAGSSAAAIAGGAVGDQQASLAAEHHEGPHHPQPGSGGAAAARAMLTASGSSRAALGSSGHSFSSASDASCTLSGLSATGSNGFTGATSCLYTTAGGASSASFLSGRSSSCWGEGSGCGGGGTASLLPGRQGSVTLPSSGPAAARSRLDPSLSQSRRESSSSCEHSPMVSGVSGSGGSAVLGGGSSKRFLRNPRRSSCDPFLMVRPDTAGGGGGGGVIGDCVSGRGPALITPTAVQRQAMSYGAAEPCNTTGYMPLLTQLAGYVDLQPHQQQVVVHKPKLGNTGGGGGGGGGCGGAQGEGMDMQSPFTAPTWAADERP